MTLERASLLPVSYAEPVSQLRLSVAPPVPVHATLPPPVRAARMFKTVRMVAARIARQLPRHVELDDLVGAGALGLADALSRRNGMRSNEFEAFAACRIRGAILDELRRLDAMPRRARATAKKVARATHAVEQRAGAPASADAIATELGLNVESYQTLRGQLDMQRPPIPLSAPANDDEGSDHEIADAKGEAPDAIVSRGEIAELVLAGIHTLPERMRRILVDLYVEGRTLKDIGAALGVSESRVCQIHSEAISILRSELDEGNAPPMSGIFRAARARTNEHTPQAQRRLA